MQKLEPAAFESLERLGHGLVSQVRRRLELMAVEISEEEIRFARALGWQLLALFLSCLLIALTAMLVVVVFWDTSHRVASVIWLIAIAVVASGVTWWFYRRQVQRKPVVFSQTIEELRRDAEALAPGPAGDVPAMPYAPRPGNGQGDRL
jgi:uncharacterized membrane protein YqjE